jgi:hypothetical protein
MHIILLIWHKMIKRFYDSKGMKKIISIPVCLMVLQVHQEYLLNL